MRVVLSQLGEFCGSADEWTVEYERLGEKFNFEPKEGVTLGVFREIMGHEEELMEAPEGALSGELTSASEGESEAVTPQGRLAAANTEKNRATKGPPGQRASQMREPPAQGSAEAWGVRREAQGDRMGPKGGEAKGQGKRGKAAPGAKGQGGRKAGGGRSLGGGKNKRRGTAPGATR